MHGIIWRGERVRLKLDTQGQMSGRISNADGQWVGVPENWTIPLDVVCIIPNMNE